jgi:hypothetical protein
MSYGFGFTKGNDTTEGTSMLVDLIANPEKLVDQGSRKYYEHQTHTHRNNDFDENLNSYDKKDKYDDKTDDYDKHKDKDYSRSHKKYDTDKKSDTSETDRDKDTEIDKKRSKQMLVLKKMDMLRKLGEMREKKCIISKNYSLDDDIEDMEFEYNLHQNILSKRRSTNWMSGMMIGLVQGIELLNDSCNPIDMKFEGAWSNDVTANIENYYDAIGDIYEKYNTPGKPKSPELNLFLLLIASAVQIQFVKGAQTAGKGKLSAEEYKKLRQESENSKIIMQEKLRERHQQNQSNAMETLANVEQLNKYKMEDNNMKNMANNIPKMNQKKMDLAFTENSEMINEKAAIVRQQFAQTQQSILANQNLIEKQQRLVQMQQKLNKNQKLIEQESEKINLKKINSDKGSSLSMSSKKSTVSNMSNLSVRKDITDILRNKILPPKVPSRKTSSVTESEIRQTNNIITQKKITDELPEDEILKESISIGRQNRVTKPKSTKLTFN